MRFLTIVLIMMGSFAVAQNQIQLNYTVDPTQNLDTFYVTAQIIGLVDENNIYQFASTAPGTYQTMNIGRFVSDFKALDRKGKELKINKLSVNQYEILKPKRVANISYKVAETFDTPVQEFPVYPMAGSSIEEDHCLLNPHTVIGYFTGLQSHNILLKVRKQSDWKEGSAMSKAGGFYYAENYDHLVDSPVLLGKLTTAETMVSDTKVQLFTYSKNDKITSEELLSHMQDMLQATEKFLVKLPVPRYTFLYHFEPDVPQPAGAWEHSYSSTYTLTESNFKPDDIERVADIASHEFFHIVTPLNIHSEVVESFNFVSPTPSKHLWLYEGVTEWASNILMMRGGVVPLESYLNTGIAQKIMVNEFYFDKTWSLNDLAEQSFTEKGAKQYGNIYYKGAFVAFMLDVRLLELSDGKKGLREVLLELVEKYGKGNPVSEENFFDDFTAMTYPEMASFFETYMMGSEALPYEEYLNKIGLTKNIEGKNVTVKELSEKTEEQQKLFDAWHKAL